MTEAFAFREAERRTRELGKRHYVAFVIGSSEPASAFLVLDRKVDTERVVIVGEERITTVAELMREEARRIGF